jgi:hypothetical protein
MSEDYTNTATVFNGIVFGMGVKPVVIHSFELVSNINNYMRQKNYTLHRSYKDEKSALDEINCLLSNGNLDNFYIVKDSQEALFQVWIR